MGRRLLGRSRRIGSRIYWVPWLLLWWSGDGVVMKIFRIQRCYRTGYVDCSSRIYLLVVGSRQDRLCGNGLMISRLGLTLIAIAVHCQLVGCTVSVFDVSTVQREVSLEERGSATDKVKDAGNGCQSLLGSSQSSRSLNLSCYIPSPCVGLNRMYDMILNNSRDCRRI